MGRQSDGSATEVVSAFYKAIAAFDGDGVGRLIDSSFSDEVVLVLPASLPYGGTIRGRERVRRALLAGVRSPVPIGPREVVVTGMMHAPVNDGSRVAVELSFDWYEAGASHGVASGAVEVWAFDTADHVTSIRAYYDDTAALATSVAPAAAQAAPTTASNDRRTP